MVQKTLRKIKDPIHQYVYYSSMEEILINHPLILRLHHIRQNGAAFLTYPSIRVHRFEHSIGTMHIAGQMFLHGTRFSNDTNLGKTYESILLRITGKKTIKEVRDDALSADENYKRQRPTALHADPLYKLHHLDQLYDDAVFVRLVFFQAIRLVALIHDVGHPPFSHTFETALKQLEIEQYRDHEEVGVQILSHLFANLPDFTDSIFYYFGKLIIPIAEAIFDKQNDHHLLVKGLADTVSGDVDADRLDYVRRDALAAGLTTNAYDLGRLYDAAKLKTSSANTVLLRWTPDALSTFEAFFAVRFHLYRWALWHHHVVRQNMALTLIIKYIWELVDDGNQIIANSGAELNELKKIATDTKEIGDYWFFTDYYLLEKFSRLLRHLQRTEEDWRGNSAMDWGKLADLYKFLRTFLLREKKWLTPFWKRPASYVNFSRLVVGDSPEHHSQVFNKKLAVTFGVFEKDVILRVNPSLSVDSEAFKEARKNYKEYVTGQFTEKLEEAVNLALKPKNLKIRAYYISKFNAAPQDFKLSVLDEGGEREYDLAVLSPSIGALQEAWMALPQLWLFLEYRAYGSDGEILGQELDKEKVKPQDVYDEVANSLRKFIEPSV